MNIAEWKNAILAALERLADRNYQKCSWFGESSKVSSPDEIFCELFDDLDFEDYLRSEDIKLDEQQRALAETLKIQMNQYASQTETVLDPHKVVDDPKWENIRRTARKLADALKRAEYAEDDPAGNG